MSMHTNIHTFIHKLSNNYSVYFDVYQNEMLDDMKLAFAALYKRRDERYMLMKKFKIYGVENQQIVFTTVHEHDLTVDFVKQFKNRIEENFKQYISTHEEHMSTVVLGMIVTNGFVDQKTVKEVTRYRKVKLLKFGLHGWAECYLAIVQYEDKDILIHGKGKAYVQSIEKLLGEERVTL